MTAAVRASDAEREEVVRVLQKAAGDGRLTPEEAGERLALASAARYRDDLDPLVADLPAEAMEPQPVAPTRGFAPWMAWRLVRFAAGAAMLYALWAGVGVRPFWLMWPLAFMAFGLLMGGRRRRWPNRWGPYGPWGWSRMDWDWGPRQRRVQR